MSPRVTIGMDLARRAAHQAVIIRGDGAEETKACKVKSTVGSLDALLEAAGGPQDCRVVLEPCGLVSIPLAAYLAHRGCEVISVDTRSAHQFRKFIKRTVKSDRVDAEALARMPAANPDRTRPVTVPSAQQFALQRLVRLRAQLVKDRSREVRRLLAALEAYVPALPGVLGEGDTLTVVKAFLLRRFLHPKAVLDAGVEGMQEALAKAELPAEGTTRLLQRWHKAAEKAWSIWEPIEAEGRCPVDFDVAQVEVELHLDRVAELTGRIGELDRRIAEAYRKADPERLVETLPGIGSTIAPAVRAFVGDIRRFPNAKAFVSYFGLAPLKSQSGNTDRGGQRISKAGNRLMRQYLFLAADNARRSDLELAAYYHRKRKAGWHHTKIVVALANKLARRLYAVLRREAAGDRTGYRFYDGEGAELDAKESTRRTRSRYPSVKAVQQRVGRGPKANDEGQSRNSPAPDPGSPAASHDSRLDAGAKAARTSGPVPIGDVLRQQLDDLGISVHGG